MSRASLTRSSARRKLRFRDKARGKVNGVHRKLMGDVHAPCEIRALRRSFFSTRARARALSRLCLSRTLVPRGARSGSTFLFHLLHNGNRQARFFLRTLAKRAVFHLRRLASFNGSPTRRGAASKFIGFFHEPPECIQEKWGGPAFKRATSTLCTHGIDPLADTSNLIFLRASNRFESLCIFE